MVFMSFNVIENPEFSKFKDRTGFKNHEFKKLAGFYSLGASHKVLYDMAVDVDFEEKSCMVSYYQSQGQHPFLQFVIKQVGPKTIMYELFMEGKGRIAKSELFDRVTERLEKEIMTLIENS